MPEFLRGQQSFIALLVIIAVVLIGGIIIFNNRDQGEVTEEAVGTAEQVEQTELDLDDLKIRIEESTPEQKEELKDQFEEKKDQLKTLREDLANQIEEERKDLEERIQNSSEEEKQELKKQLAEKIEEAKKVEKAQGKSEQEDFPKIHTVSRGDHLWGIATNFYNDGYKWTVLAAENNIQNPDIILPGQKLTIPEPKDRTYTVVAGDTLWGISERFYGTGFQWTTIRNANPGAIGTLSNGNPLIRPGQILKIP